jgi:hypothetical protein
MVVVARLEIMTSTSWAISSTHATIAENVAFITPTPVVLSLVAWSSRMRHSVVVAVFAVMSTSRSTFASTSASEEKVLALVTPAPFVLFDNCRSWSGGNSRDGTTVSNVVAVALRTIVFAFGSSTD